MARVWVLGLLALLWSAAAVTAVFINTRTNVLWSAEAAYLLVGAAVAAAWGATAAVLRKLGLELPYRPA